MVTLRDIASEAGVSIWAASVVLRGQGRTARISPDRESQIREIAARLHYRPHAAARAMRSQRTGLVGVLVRSRLSASEAHSGSLAVLMGINAELEEADHAMCLVRLSDGGKDPLRARVFRERMLDGMIIVNAVPDELGPRIEKLVPHCIWADHNRFDPTCCVQREETAAGALVAQQLCRLGYRRLIYVDHESADVHYSGAQRRAGAQQMAAQLGIPFAHLQLDWSRPLNKVPLELKSLTPETAVIGYCAMTTRRVMMACSHAGLRWGVDYAIACCESDQHTWGAEDVIARAMFNRSGLGRRAARMMLELLMRPRSAPPSVKMPSEWTAGASAPGRERGRGRSSETTVSHPKSRLLRGGSTEACSEQSPIGGSTARLIRKR